MATSVGDFKLASAAAGFTLGFGVLTVWEAIRQTRAIRSPLRSVYIYMVWGEILANLLIGIFAWLFLNGTLGPSIPLYFSVLVCWVFEIQFLMQIIINRIAVVVDDRRLVNKVKWGTAGIITLINIAVFIIWIPAHLNPHPIPIFVDINTYWSRISKTIILLVDAGLNYYFLYTVKKRLVKYHGLTKYAPLVRFNACLMVVSIGMDLMIICLLSLQNQMVYIQFHPVAYMVKLNIELTMASLIRKIARATINNNIGDGGEQYSSQYQTHSILAQQTKSQLKSGNHASASAKIETVSAKAVGDDFDGIRTTTEVYVEVENVPSVDGDSVSDSGVSGGFDQRHRGPTGAAKGQQSTDELPLSPMEVVPAQFETQSWKGGSWA